MGEEADADWQAGLIEMGRELEFPPTRREIRDAHERARKPRPCRCWKCGRGFKKPPALAQHDKDSHQ